MIPFFRVFLFAVLILTAESFAFAQERAVLETIRVRGTKENKGYFQNAESVSILQENELPATGTENNLQILNAVPNVEVNKNGESFSIRGINNTGVTGYQKDNLSSLVIDELFQTDLAIQAGSFDLWDFERIEILRGAQSTSQGVNSLAGTILLDHHRATFSKEGAAKLGLGSFWFRELGIVTNNQIIASKLASRVSYSKELNDGYIENRATNNSKWGGWNRDRASLDLGYKLGESSRLNMNAKFSRNDQGGTYTQGQNPFADEVDEDEDLRAKTKNLQVSSTFENRVSERLRTTSLLGYSVSDQDSKSDADGTNQATAGIRTESHDDRYLTFESRANFESDRFSNLLGIHVHDFKLDDVYDFNLLFPLSASTSTPVAVYQGVERKRTAYSVFDSVTYRLDQKNSFIGGIRAEYVKSSYGTSVAGQRLNDLGAGTNTAVDTYISQISGAYEGENSDFVLLPKLGYSFESGAHFAGLNFTRGYRTSGVSINRRRATAVEYDPEFTNNYELSYKYQASPGFDLSSNMFFIDWRDQQVQVQLSNDFYDTQVQNAARSQVYGAEVEGRKQLTSTQSLKLGAGYSQTKFRDFTASGVSYEGNEFPFASNWTGRIAHEIKPLAPLSLLTVLRYVGDSYSNAENTRKTDAQFYVNLNAKYAFSSWVVEGYINNALNGKYQLFDGRPTSATSPYQASYHQVSTPREFGARAVYYW